MSVNSFDEVGWTHGRRKAAPTKVNASPEAIAALDRQRRVLDELEANPVYIELCAVADSKRVALNNAAKYGSGRLVNER